MSCINEQRKKDINHVRILAETYSKGTEQDIDIVQKNIAGIGKTFDFVPTKENSIKAIETIKFRKLKSKDVLLDTGKPNGKLAPIKPAKIRSKSRKPIE